MKSINKDYSSSENEAALSAVCKNLFNIESERISIHTLNTVEELETFGNDWKNANNSGLAMNSLKTSQNNSDKK